MAIGLGTRETFDVGLGEKVLTFRHLSVREARQFNKDLDAYLNATRTSDDDAADAALALVQPFTSVQLADELTTAEAVLLPLAFQNQRSLSERELGKLLWQRTFAVGSSAESANTAATTDPTPTPP